MALAHQPVLLAEALAALAIEADGFYVDATFGRGGHTAAILAQLGAEGRLLGIDKDPQAAQIAREQFAHEPRFSFRQGSFALLEQFVAETGMSGKVSGVLMDLGVSSPQLDDPARGFSFLRSGPLDMRMNPAEGVSAADWLRQTPESEIARVLREYGEERFARRIAAAIVRHLKEQPITTTQQLAEIVRAAIPKWEKHKDPATRSFQAIRIAVNQELEDLSAALMPAVRVLKKGGRLVVISFHSLEDRMVKRFMRDHAKAAPVPKGLPVMPQNVLPMLKLIGKAVRAGEAECEANPRARSAVMRIAERLS
jgi:16S rRNA (cytosine1402-N4)-methyltransferase